MSAANLLQQHNSTQHTAQQHTTHSTAAHSSGTAAAQHTVQQHSPLKYGRTAFLATDGFARGLGFGLEDNDRHPPVRPEVARQPPVQSRLARWSPGPLHQPATPYIQVCPHVHLTTHVCCVSKCTTKQCATKHSSVHPAAAPGLHSPPQCAPSGSGY